MFKVPKTVRRTRDATIDRTTRCRRLHDAIAARAGQLRATVTGHAEVRPQVFELPSDVVGQFTTARRHGGIG